MAASSLISVRVRPATVRDQQDGVGELATVLVTSPLSDDEKTNTA